MSHLKSSLIELGGFWQYEQGKRYLALLASGKLSDTFLNTGVLTTCPRRLRDATIRMADEVTNIWSSAGYYPDNQKTICIGPGMGGVTLAYELAYSLGCFSPFEGKQVVGHFTEPEVVAGNKLQKYRFGVDYDALHIFCEDVITTGGSVQKTIDAVVEAAGEKHFSICPYVLCLVDRRDQKGPLGIRIKNVAIKLNVISMLSVSARTWDTLEQAQKDCPSVVEAIRAKSNWKKLVEG